MVRRNLECNRTAHDKQKIQLDNLVSRIDILMEEHNKMQADITKLEKGVIRLKAQILVEINFCNYNVSKIFRDYITAVSPIKTKTRSTPKISSENKFRKSPLPKYLHCIM